MKTLLKNATGFITGLVAGGLVNMGLVTLGPRVIPPPPGVDMTSTASLIATAHLLESKHFLFPFLAHAAGTLVGALLAATMAASHRAVWAYAIGVLTLAGGIAAATMIPAPTWFLVTDLVFAYIPMAWLGLKIARSIRKETN